MTGVPIIKKPEEINANQWTGGFYTMGPSIMKELKRVLGAHNIRETGSVLAHLVFQKRTKSKNIFFII